MKKVVYFSVMIIVALIAASCGPNKTSEDIGSVRQPSEKLTQFLRDMDDWVADQPEPIDSIDFRMAIDALWPEHSMEIQKELREAGIIEKGEIVGIEYLYFKKGVCSMQDSTGRYVKRVDLANEFIIQINRPGKESLWVSLACRNGVKNIRRAFTLAQTEVPLIIEIDRKGDCLYNHTGDVLFSIWIAERLGLRMYVKENGKRTWLQYEEINGKITSPYDQARKLFPKTSPDYIIDARVEQGWIITVYSDHVRIYHPDYGSFVDEHFCFEFSKEHYELFYR